jgi:hypothetical protein
VLGRSEGIDPLPRFVPKRARAPEPLAPDDEAPWTPPAPAPLHFVPRLSVRSSFTCEGVLFREGAIVSAESERVQAILREYPLYFERASNLD